MPPEEHALELNMDPTQLYREEVITDQRMGTIRRLIPVSVNGDTDGSRAVQYIGSAQVLTPAGALPLSFPIEAQSLEQAVDGFAAAAKKALAKKATGKKAPAKKAGGKR